VAPKIRYNIKDLGGSVSYRDVASVLAERGMSIESLADVPAGVPVPVRVRSERPERPVLRGEGVHDGPGHDPQETPEIGGMFSSFQLSVRETEDLEKKLVVRLERAPEGEGIRAPGSPSASSGPDADLGPLLYERLKEVNQDFREVSKLFSPGLSRPRSTRTGRGPSKRGTGGSRSDTSPSRRAVAPAPIGAAAAADASLPHAFLPQERASQHPTLRAGACQPTLN